MELLLPWFKGLAADILDKPNAITLYWYWFSLKMIFTSYSNQYPLVLSFANSHAHSVDIDKLPPYASFHVVKILARYGLIDSVKSSGISNARYVFVLPKFKFVHPDMICLDDYDITCLRKADIYIQPDKTLLQLRIGTIWTNN